MIFKRVVSASLSPNSEKDDVLLAFRVLYSPSLWSGANARTQVEKWFANYFSNTKTVTFNSGRSALCAILRAFEIGSGDEVIIQAFTCVAVPNSVLWAGAKPVYADIDESFNLDPTDALKKISKHTRAIIVQHTFGIPADMEKLAIIAKKKNILLIEDCAHCLGATYKGKKIGSIGDAACFSFGRDKVLSSVFGGLALIAGQHAQAFSRLKEIHGNMPYPGSAWVLQQLIHPVAFSCILPLYSSGLGKFILVILQKMRLLGFPVYPEEKSGKKPIFFPRKYPNALAVLLVHQLKKLERFNATRRLRSAYYRQKLKNVAGMTLPSLQDGASYLRFPLLTDNPKKIALAAKKRGILLGNWYHNIVDPDGVNFTRIFYIKGSCPRAEYAATHILNLPTNISEQDAKRVLQALT